MDTLSALNVSGSTRAGDSPERVSEVTLGFEPASLNLLFGGKEAGCNLLMRYLGLLERPEAGEILLKGESTHGWPDAQLIETRSRHFGYIFEAPLLVPSFNVAENVALPFFKLTQASPQQTKEATALALEHVGLSDAAEENVETLPLWVQMRVALARALVLHPQAVFVEGVDTLFRDSELISMLELLATTRQTLGCCIVATAAHADLVQFATRAIEMADGRVERDWKPGGLSLS